MTQWTNFVFSIMTAVSCLICMCASQARADAEYELVIIEPWNTTYSLATSSVGGLNNLNQVTGCATPISGNCSFIWTREIDKTPINIAGPINDFGVITASGYIRWPDGTLQEMDGPMGAGADLNNATVVVGSDGSVHTCPTPPPWVDREATVWTPDGGTVLVQQQLGVWAADQAWAINNNNQLVGVTSTTGHCGDQKAFYYDLNTNQHIDLHMLWVGQSSGITHAVDINDAGVVIGDGPVSIGGGAFRWSAVTGLSFIPELPGTLSGYSIPSSINNDGTVVGQAIVNEEWRAWIWDEQHGIRDLNALAEGIPAGFVIEEAKRINDNGWIIGRGHYGTWSPTRAVVMIPITTQVLGDISGDGVVGVPDLLIVINSWSSNCPTPCPADLSGDGAVGVADLLMVINNWG